MFEYAREHIVFYTNDKCYVLTYYSLRLKMIVLPPGIFFCPKMIVRFICPTINLRLKVKYFRAKLPSSRSLSTPQFRGAFWSSSSFLFEESYLQLLGQWSVGLILAKVRNTDNHLGTEGVVCKWKIFLSILMPSVICVHFNQHVDYYVT